MLTTVNIALLIVVNRYLLLVYNNKKISFKTIL